MSSTEAEREQYVQQLLRKSLHEIQPKTEPKKVPFLSSEESSNSGAAEAEKNLKMNGDPTESSVAAGAQEEEALHHPLEGASLGEERENSASPLAAGDEETEPVADGGDAAGTTGSNGEPDAQSMGNKESVEKFTEEKENSAPNLPTSKNKAEPKPASEDPLSPPPLPRGAYNIDWDNLDSLDPFASSSAQPLPPPLVPAPKHAVPPALKEEEKEEEPAVPATPSSLQNGGPNAELKEAEEPPPPPPPESSDHKESSEQMESKDDSGESQKPALHPGKEDNLKAENQEKAPDLQPPEDPDSSGAEFVDAPSELLGIPEQQERAGGSANTSASTVYYAAREAPSLPSSSLTTPDNSILSAGSASGNFNSPRETTVLRAPDPDATPRPTDAHRELPAAADPSADLVDELAKLSEEQSGGSPGLPPRGSYNIDWDNFDESAIDPFGTSNKLGGGVKPANKKAPLAQEARTQAKKTEVAETGKGGGGDTNANETESEVSKQPPAQLPKPSAEEKLNNNEEPPLPPQNKPASLPPKTEPDRQEQEPSLPPVEKREEPLANGLPPEALKFPPPLTNDLEPEEEEGQFVEAKPEMFSEEQGLNKTWSRSELEHMKTPSSGNTPRSAREPLLSQQQTAEAEEESSGVARKPRREASAPDVDLPSPAGAMDAEVDRIIASTPRSASGDESAMDALAAKLKLQFQAAMLAKEREWSSQLDKHKEEVEKLKSNLAAARAEADQAKQQATDMGMVVSEYEKTMGQMMSSSGGMASVADMTKLIRERDQALEDLHAVENSFAELHRRYEKIRGSTEEFKRNEDFLKENMEKLEEKLRKSEENFAILRGHAEEKLAKANEEIQRLEKAKDTDTLAIRAQLKKSELHVQTLEKSLETKSKEIAELTAICDELIQKASQPAS